MQKLVLTIVAVAGMLHATAQTQIKKQISLEDIWKNGTFSQKSVSGFNSMNDGKHYTSFWQNPLTKKNYVLVYEYASGKVSDTLVREQDLIVDGKNIELQNYSLSNDENKLMIASDIEAIYRRSSLENNFIYDIKSKKLNAISGKGKQKYALFSPDGSKVAFVRDNNLFVIDLATNTETALTSDGKNNEIINGGTDWVYEEEFEFARAFSWSPDGKKIAYYRFDERAVKEFSFSKYGGLYPEEYRYKYPKAGEDNSLVSIHIYDLASSKTTTTDIGTEKDQYIPRIKWASDAELCVLRMNRLQNKLDYLLADANTGATKVLLTEESKTYVEVNDDLSFLKNKQFIISSEKDGFRHLYLYDMAGKQVNQLTKGNWDITGFYGVDEKNGVLYYQSAESSAMQRGVYSLALNTLEKKLLSTRAGSNDAVFTSSYDYFINYYSNANTPLIVSLNDKTGKPLRILEDNMKLRDKLNEFVYNKKEFFKMNTSENIELNGWMIKPTDFDASKKYPVLMFVYGGPGSQQVLDSWGGANLMWYQLMAQKGYIVVCVDNRGTGARGRDFKNCTYMELGKLETIDQIEAAKWLGKQAYVDANRIGIQGWSYGGYMSSLCITKGADVFKAAVAVAPVTTWRYYDSIYTERYLRRPQENAKGYDENSPINFTDKIKGKFLLIHGMADDNVHFQNATDLVTSLVKNNKQFESAYYPNKNHGIGGGNTRLHLYTKMTDFLLGNL